MILADKIIENRKKNGWSQEELADKLGVSRQSVSKWEGAQAVPDMKKILQLAELFNVTTDYLLKDEIEDTERPDIPISEDIYEEESLRKVSMEEANAFLDHNETSARRISTGVMLCILSPVLMIVLGGFANAGRLPFDVYRTEIGGVIILLLMVACAVALFLISGMKGKPYEYLENVNIDTEYGVSGMVKERKAAYQGTHSRLLIIGILLCVISAVPMFIYEFLHYHHDDGTLDAIVIGMLLVMVAAGVKLIVLTCVREGGFEKLLEEGDYTRINKRAGRYDGIYWAIATAVYLGWSFASNRWDITWMVWPVAGVLFAAYREIMKAIVRSTSK